MPSSTTPRKRGIEECLRDAAFEGALMQETFDVSGVSKRPRIEELSSVVTTPMEECCVDGTFTKSVKQHERLAINVVASKAESSSTPAHGPKYEELKEDLSGKCVQNSSISDMTGCPVNKDVALAELSVSKLGTCNQNLSTDPVPEHDTVQCGSKSNPNLSWKGKGKSRETEHDLDADDEGPVENAEDNNTKLQSTVISPSAWLPAVHRPKIRVGEPSSSKVKLDQGGGFSVLDLVENLKAEADSRGNRCITAAWFADQCPDPDAVCHFYEQFVTSPGMSLTKFLNILAGTLRQRFEDTRNSVHIDKSLSFIVRAKELICSKGDNDIIESLADLYHAEALGLYARFQMFRDVDDLNCAVDSWEQGLNLVGDNDPERKRTYIHSLMVSLLMRLEYLGKIGDIIRVITS